MPDPTPDIVVDTTVPAAICGKKTKLALTAVLAPSLYFLEWGLVGLTAALVSFLKYRGFSDLSVWLLLWVLNLVYSSAIVFFSDRSQIDITLMNTMRRLTNSVAGKSRLSGVFMEAIVFLRLLLWDGPCRLLIYFRERLPSAMLRGFLFVAASGLQMYIWMKLYVLGYESVGDLLKMVW